MIASLTLILLCQLAGEIFVRALALPMPGPVVGLLLLLILLLLRDRFALLARGPLQGNGVEASARGLVYLSQTPLLWLTVTLLVYATADAVSLATGRHPFANPVFHSMWIIAAFLLLTGTSYTTYFSGAQFVHFLLGPATVALAVPLYENRKVVMAAILPMLVALIVGCVTAIGSVVLLAQAFGLPRDLVLSLAPKSVTAGVAMGISESLGADASLTAVAVILTGIMGAMIVTPLMNWMGVTDFRARGFAVGLASHGIGTARAFQVDAVAGVFAGIAMSLNALVTSLLVPIAVTLLVRG